MSSSYVLIVDDDADFVEILADHLKSVTKQIETAVSGSEALEKFEKFSSSVKLVLIDYKIPDIDGYELMKTFVDRGFSGQFAIVTGWRPEKELEPNLAEKVAAFFEKPIDFDEVTKTVVKVLQ